MTDPSSARRFRSTRSLVVPSLVVFVLAALALTGVAAGLPVDTAGEHRLDASPSHSPALVHPEAADANETTTDPETNETATDPETNETTATASRELDRSTLAPGESTTVTLELAVDNSSAPAVYESVDAGAVTIVDDGGAAASGVDADGLVFAVWSDTDTITLVYEVTAPESATGGDRLSFEGTVDVAGQSVPVTGASAITVAPDIATVERTLESTTLEPGASTTVTLEVDVDGVDDVALYETFDPAFAAIEHTDSEPTPTVSGVNADGSGLVAVWENTTSALLEYEVTVPDDATDGERITLTGVVDGTADSAPVGTSEITVETADESGGSDDGGSSGGGDGGSSGGGGDTPPTVTSTERSFESATLEPGTSTTVTVVAETDRTGDLTVTETFDAAVTADLLETTPSAETATADEDGVEATWADADHATLTYEVTLPSDWDPGDTLTIDGEASTDGDTVAVEGVDRLFADATGDDGHDDPGSITAATRSLEHTTVPPGESTTVTLEVETDEPASPALYESVDPVLTVTSLDADGALVSGHGSDGLVFAVWAETTSATLSYEVELPADAADGETFALDGDVDVASGSAGFDGPTTLTAGERAAAEPADENGGTDAAGDAGEATTPSASAGVPFETDADTGETVATVTDTPVEEVRLEGAVDGSLTVTAYDAVPDGLASVPGALLTVTRLEVPDDVSNSSATVRLALEPARLDEVGADAADLGVFRHADDGWQALERERLDGGERVALLVEMPAASSLAVSAVGHPDAVLTADVDVLGPGEDLTLTGSASADPFGDLVAYEWSVVGPDGDRRSLAGETVTTTLETPGEYTVDLTVRNDAGETDTATATVTVTDAPMPDGADTGADDAPGSSDDADDADPAAGDDGSPGFTAGAALLALFALSFLVRSGQVGSRSPRGR